MTDRDAVVRELHDRYCYGRETCTTRECYFRSIPILAFEAGQAHERAAVVRFLDVFDCPDCHPDGPHYPCSSDSHALAEYDAISRGAHHTKGEP